MTRSDVRTITDAATLAALAHPFRARMMDALKVDGPSTASMLASRTGQAVANASHHLKVLSEAGLVEEAPELARDRRERWWRLVSSSTRWNARDFRGSVVAQEAAALDLQRQVDRARAWLCNAESAPEWDGAAYATQMWLRLTPDELREVAAEVVALLQRWSERTPPDDGAEREPVFVFSQGFPSQP
ncbi:ArsR/SmtB family transcription factor [Flexivirga caeni]|uniref:ArsR family transcriptional regulator n=1 Tax=Flexivirga caeni TaxID=2294115 RepID=A0A3M9MGP6_9MICO|nr:helix-turn-helix domain-containing protein [Flexivirga caeni]RNI24729.1 ArsR family transcriptional regulator [Flexivirga caeni]